MNTSVKVARVAPVVCMALVAILFLSQIPSAQADMMTVLFSVRVTELNTDNDDGRLAGIQIGGELKGSLEFLPDCARIERPTWCQTDTAGSFLRLGNLTPQSPQFGPFELDILNNHGEVDALNFNSFLEEEHWQIRGETTDLDVIKCARWHCLRSMDQWPDGALTFSFSYSTPWYTDEPYTGSLTGVVTSMSVVPIPAAAGLFALAVSGFGFAAWRQRHRA